MDIILVPGFWLNASAWDAVTPPLVAAGHTVRPMTLPGMDSVEADRSGITLADHVDAVVAAIDALPDDAEIVLVGHSGGGAVIHSAADRRPARITRAVYTDSFPLGDGGAINPDLPVVDGEIPLPDWSVFDEPDLAGLDDALQARLRAMAIPTPARVASDPVRLTDERRYDVPTTVIACEYFGSFDGPRAMYEHFIAQDDPFTRELAAMRDCEIVELPTGHWPMFTRPVELGEAIAAAVAR
ncbi:alpha/beta hydrolase [Isoptericola sp. AK164]|uniref:alpha/beta fold hydrolase n=1 Tax=Isoptericola sp. AK164 TaxID=3024246 RepID=UPI002418B2AA|nr:alpha/beta hydrolase [Isoptericola sp. AK164]